MRNKDWSTLGIGKAENEISFIRKYLYHCTITPK